MANCSLDAKKKNQLEGGTIRPPKEAAKGRRLDPNTVEGVVDAFLTPERKAELWNHLHTGLFGCREPERSAAESSKEETMEEYIDRMIEANGGMRSLWASQKESMASAQKRSAKKIALDLDH